MNANDPKGEVGKIIDAIMSDPDEFYRLGQNFLRRERTKVSPQDWANAIEWSIQKGIKSRTSAEEDKENAIGKEGKEMSEMFGDKDSNEPIKKKPTEITVGRPKP